MNRFGSAVMCLILAVLAYVLGDHAGYAAGYSAGHREGRKAGQAKAIENLTGIRLSPTDTTWVFLTVVQGEIQSAETAYSRH